MKPGQFSRGCLLISVLWLVLISPALNWLHWQNSPKVTPDSHIDFFQYYAGATVVRHGIWDSLYPIPKLEVYDEPNHFVPRFKTFLFNPATASREPAFYPALNLAKASDSTPELLGYFPEQADQFRFIYPPPTALFVWPLSFFSFHFAADYLWPTLSLWALCALSFFSARIHRTFRQADSYTEGFIILACVLFSYKGQTHIAAGNVTPILSALIAVSVYALMRNRLAAFSCVYVPLVLFKTIGLSWLLLLLLNRAYWRAFIYLAILALLLNGITVELAGFGVYEKFFSLVPKIVVPAGIGIIPGFLYTFGFYPHTLFLIIELTCLGFLYYGYWNQVIRDHFKRPVTESSLALAALLAGTIAIFCLTNFTTFLAYCPCYLFFPFLGWILQEGYLATGFWRYFVLGGTALAFLVLAGDWIVREGLLHVFSAEKADTYFILIDRPFYIGIIPLFFLIVAFGRLLFLRDAASR